MKNKSREEVFVSIYTTIYNIKSCETNCVEEILNQTHKNFEWIVVYDLEEDYIFFRNQIKQDKRIKFFKNSSKGRWNALILAIEKCKSEFIFNQDYDDLPKKNRIELQLNNLLQNKNIAAVGGWYMAYYKDQNLLEEHFDSDNINQIKIRLTFMLPFAHTFCGFRKSALESIGGYPNDSILEDGLIWARLIAKGYKVSLVKRNIGTHFIHKNTNFGKLGSSREFNFLKERYRIRSTLKLPLYINILITFRFIYRYLPYFIRRIIRKMVAGYKRI